MNRTSNGNERQVVERMATCRLVFGAAVRIWVSRRNVASESGRKECEYFIFVQEIA